ncbi:MAG: branched-chain amino acid ABC transporter permease [Actinomycetes bacterium]|jgi:branched-chain amino acid transport system permease protein|nr:branched-chain amino acid ABC transporter permease [Actinomycetes bacterium]
MFNYIVSQLVNGVTLGGMYALIALGYTLVYGILLMINFAHSEMFMSGGYIGLGVLNLLSNKAVQAAVVARLPFLAFLQSARTFFTGSTIGMILMLLIVFGISAVLTGCLGMLTERFAYRPLRNAPRLCPLISALGISIFLQNAALLWIDNSIPFPSLLPTRDFGFGITPIRIFIIVTSLILLFVLDRFVSTTRIGKAMRATSQDQDAAGLMGIDINSVIALTFFIGPALGAVAGIFSGMYYGVVTYNMGFFPGIKSFTAAVLGGIGNLRGAMLGGFMLGIIEALASGFISSGYKDVIAFVILIIVLIFRPGGLLGESVVEKV